MGFDFSFRRCDAVRWAALNYLSGRGFVRYISIIISQSLASAGDYRVVVQG